MMALNEVTSDHQMASKEKVEKENAGNPGDESRCSKMEHNGHEDVNEECLNIRVEIQKKGKELEGVRVRIRVLEGEKAVLEEEIEGLKKRKVAFGEAGVNESAGEGELISESDDGASKDGWMVEEAKDDEVMEFGKGGEVSEVVVWKRKCKKLEERVVELEGQLSGQRADSVPNGIVDASRNVDHMVNERDFDQVLASGGSIGEVQVEATPYIELPQEECPEIARLRHGDLVKKQLAFQNERSSYRRTGPFTDKGETTSTPTRAKPAANSSDSDDEHNSPDNHKFNLPSRGVQKRRRNVVSDDECDKEEPTVERRTFIHNADNESEEADVDTPSKRAGSRADVDPEGENDNHGVDQEDDDDDNKTLSQLFHIKNRHSSQSDRRTRHLVKMGDLGQVNDANSPETLGLEDLQDVGCEANYGTDSDADSFISDSDENMEDELSEEYDTDNVLEGDATEQNAACNPDEPSQFVKEYCEVMASLQRQKQHNLEWKSEADMLSDFGKDPMLCMRAVCAMNRREIIKRKSYSTDDVLHGFGFSNHDAPRGESLSNFLTDGNIRGDVVKSVEELEQYDPDGVEVCEKLAKRYSRQMFEIFENESDRFFPRSSCSGSVTPASSSSSSSESY